MLLIEINMDNQINTTNQSTQQSDQVLVNQSQQETKVKYKFYDPTSLVSNKNSLIVFLLILSFGASFFAVIYGILLGVNLKDLFNYYEHVNIMFLSFISIILILIVFNVINEGGLHLRKLKTKVSLSYRINTFFLAIELILVFYFGLKNNPLWYFFFILCIFHCFFFTKHYQKVSTNMISETLGKEVAGKYTLSMNRPFGSTLIYLYIIIPMLNLIEFYLIVWPVLQIMPYGIIYGSILSIIICIQDILLILFLRKIRKNHVSTQNHQS